MIRCATAGHIAAVALAGSYAAAGVGPADADSPPGRFLTVGYTLTEESGFDGGIGAVSGALLSAKETRIVAGLSPADDSSGLLDLGIDYQYTRYGYDAIESRNRDLHRLQVPIGIRASTDRWRIDAFLAPGIATSSNVFKDLPGRASGDDYFATARAEWAYEVSGASAWLLGVAWDRSFGEPRLYPIVGWHFSASPRVDVRIAFPDPSVRIAATGRQTVMWRLYPAGFEWHVLDDDLVTEFDYSVDAWRTELWWSLKAWRTVYIDLSLGYEFERRHSFTNRIGTRIDQDIGDSVLVTAGVRWRDGPRAPTNRIARSDGG